MQRDIQQLKSDSFDVLVIGGGIYGSWIAFHAANSGLKVALVEQSDWGSATSSASSKLLHGGLRYLERFEIGLVRKSLHERRELNRLLPHHVRPLRFLFPVYSHSRVGRFRLKLGLWLYDRLAGSNQPVAGHQRYSAAEMLKQEPAFRDEHLLGGFSYGDCGTDDARVNLEVVDSAITAGAVACHYVRVESLLREEGRIVGATVLDREVGSTFDVRASMVVNTAGPWVNRIDGIQQANGVDDGSIRLTKGVHLVLPAMTSGHAVLLTAKSDGRVFFLIPWYGRTLVGTTDTEFQGDPATVKVEAEDVDYLLSAANSYLRTAWKPSDLLGAFAGLRTLKNETGQSASGVSREWVFEESLPGLLTSIGGKYTSARVDGIAALDSIRTALQLPIYKRSGDSTMAWCPKIPFAAWLKQSSDAAVAVGIDRETADTAARRYGTRIEALIDRVRKSPELGRRIVADLPFCKAEILHAVEHEMARTLDDIVRRRIPLRILTPLSRESLTEICDLVAPHLQWTPDRQRQEVETVLGKCMLPIAT